jgi:hypothetical protein
VTGLRDRIRRGAPPPLPRRPRPPGSVRQPGSESMTPEQIAIFAILGAALVLFVWQRWRFDVVAVVALLACVVTGLVEPTAAFAGFGHPAVITVAAVLAISRALANSGLISLLAARLAQLVRAEFPQRLALCTAAAAISGFMNNVGALALVMPVAISTAHRFGYPAARVLMPISFASILGGLTTLIGRVDCPSRACSASQVGIRTFLQEQGYACARSPRMNYPG